MRASCPEPARAGCFPSVRLRGGVIEGSLGDGAASGRRQHFAKTCSPSHNTAWLIEFATGAEVRGSSAHDA